MRASQWRPAAPAGSTCCPRSSAGLLHCTHARLDTMHISIRLSLLLPDSFPLIQRRAPPQPRHHPMRGLPWWPKVSWLGAAPPVAPWQSPTPPMSSGPAWSCRESWHAAGRWFTAERCTVGGSCMLANGHGLGCSPAEGSRARLWLAGAGAAGAAAVAAPSQCRRFHLLTLVPRRSSIPSHLQACPDGLCHTQGWSKWCSRRGLACCSAA